VRDDGSIAGDFLKINRSGGLVAITALQPTSTFVNTGGRIYDQVAVNLTALGTNQATALAITAKYNEVTTVAAATGVALPTVGAVGFPIYVFNRGANPLLVYPPPTHTINGAAAGAAFSLPPGIHGRFDYVKSLTWYVTNADLPLSGGTLTGAALTIGSGQGATLVDLNYGNTGNARINVGTTSSVFTITQGGSPTFRVNTTAGTPANFIQVNAGIAGTAVSLAATGTDTNVELDLTARGSSGVRITSIVGFNNTAPIAKPTGWGTSTGGARAAITASSTLPQVAAGLAQLLNDLTAYGLIGV
jgi:hypothetical protein